MRKYLELPIKLFAITFILGLLLGVTYMYTKEPIAEQVALQLQQSREQAFPEAEFEAVDKALWEGLTAEDWPEIQEVFIAKRNGEFAGYVVNVLSKGYGGDIAIIVGMDTDKKITGVVISSHNETAGLGANAVKEDFREQYKGKTNPVLTKDEPGSDQGIDALAGATITSRAVTSGVDAIVDLVNKLMEAQG